MRRLRGDYDPEAEEDSPPPSFHGARPGPSVSGRDGQQVMVVSDNGVPHQLLLVSSQNAPPGGLLNGGARRGLGMFGGAGGGLGAASGRRHLGGLLSGGDPQDPWATFWASMLASIIVSTDEELAQSLITMFGSGAEPPEPPRPDTLTSEQFEELEKVEYATSPDAVLATPLGNDDRPRVAEPDSCPICMCDFVDGMELMRLPCSSVHVFHARCLRTWLLEKSTNCPMCRCDCRPKTLLIAIADAASDDDLSDLDDDPTADIDTAFNAVVEAADSVRRARTDLERVPVRANHNLAGRGLMDRPSSSGMLELASRERPSTVNRLRRLVSVGREAERFLGETADGETQTVPTVDGVPSSPASSLPASTPSSPGDEMLPSDIVAIEDRLSAARQRRAEGAAREETARRAADNLASAQAALRERRERRNASTSGSADRSSDTSEWYRNHRGNRGGIPNLAALGAMESSAASRWSATSVPRGAAVVHAESETASLPTLSGGGSRPVAAQQEENPLPVPPTITPRRLDSLLDPRHGLNATNSAGRPAPRPGAADGSYSSRISENLASAAAAAATTGQPTLSQRWLSRGSPAAFPAPSTGRTAEGHSEAAVTPIESTMSQLSRAREQAAVAQRASTAASAARRSAAALNESMRAAADAEEATIAASRAVSRGGSGSGTAARAGRTSGARGAGRMRRLMREASDLEGAGSGSPTGGGSASGS